jgi:hypothetical protein
MSSYEIKKYSYNQAKKLGVSIKPSTNPKKKIDVFKDDVYLFSIGDINYRDRDYPTYLETQGEEFANKRRRIYHLRHKRDNVPNTKGWYALQILW